MVETINTALVHAARLSEEGRPHSAVALLTALLTEFPEHRTAWCRLAAAHLDAGDPAESLTAAKRAIVLGEPSWAHRLASLALVELGRHGEAVVSAREAVRREPADWRCQVALAEALAHDRPADALEAARAAVVLAPHEARAREILGDAAMRVHDWSAAEDAYAAACRLDPSDEDAAAKLARVAGRPAEDPRRPGRPVRRTPGYGRADRVALLLLARRTGGWLAAGSLALVLAGPSAPGRELAWYGLGLLVFVALLGWRGWIGLSGPARAVLPVLSTREPLIAVSAVLLGSAALAVLVWIVSLALGAGWPAALTVALGGGAGAAVTCWFGLWRVWSASRRGAEMARG